MNELIKQLTEQQGLTGPNYLISSQELEKFAHLIAGECAALCDRFQSRDVGMQPAECAGAIRKMFGVQ